LKEARMFIFSKNRFQFLNVSEIAGTDSLQESAMR
jgi:hypothetical protein